MAETARRPIVTEAQARPILKWAGGKTQLLKVLLPKVPSAYGRYLEPFFGGGALFFAVNPSEAVISDSNPELVNLYRTIASDVRTVIELLGRYPNEKDFFYEMRAKDWRTLTAEEAAARTIYLNKTAFNGLYRVNRKGEFNTPFGAYVAPNICDEENLLRASEVLSRAVILEGDYKTVLARHARAGDFVFLDPPYVPVSEYSDFKRYTKEQFSEQDQVALAAEVERLADLGCSVVLTNSNHPLVHELYGKFKIEVHSTRRNINSRSNGRRGEDVVVQVQKRHTARLQIRPVPAPLSDQALKYPSTRYMGSKSKMLNHIRDVVASFDCESVADIFSGSGVVSYMLKAEGKRVFSNDYMALGSTYAKAMVENSRVRLEPAKAQALLTPNPASDGFVSRTFQGLYFTEGENRLIDDIRANIKGLSDEFEIAIAKAALARACTKRRPRGIFTYVGHRYDDGRKDLTTSLETHFLTAVEQINAAVFDNGKVNVSNRGDALGLTGKYDLVYMDPPYYSPHSDNEYVRRYHFVEGLACDWQGCEIQQHTKTKKFKSYPTPFSTKGAAAEAFDSLFRQHRKSILLVSYSSNSLPTLDEMVSLMARHKEHVEVLSIDYRYSFGTHGSRVGDNRNSVSEYLFVGY